MKSKRTQLIEDMTEAREWWNGLLDENKAELNNTGQHEKALRIDHILVIWRAQQVDESS